jgi:hypothetical protein
MKKKIFPIILFAMSFIFTACDTEISTEPTFEQEIISEFTEAPLEDPIDGSIASEVGSTDDYIGYYTLKSETGGFPYTNAEILADDSSYMYFYSENSFEMCCLDYSEQRALGGNPLMVITIDIDDIEAEFAVEPFNYDGTKGLDFIGWGGFEGISATFELK